MSKDSSLFMNFNLLTFNLLTFSRQQVVGVIVRLEKESFKVLTHQDKEVTVSQHAVQPRKTRAVALDHHGNSITSRDIVKVISGNHVVSKEAMVCVCACVSACVCVYVP